MSPYDGIQDVDDKSGQIASSVGYSWMNEYSFMHPQDCIQDVDAKSGQMASSGWVGYSWMNEYMTWDPEHYGGIEVKNSK